MKLAVAFIVIVLVSFLGIYMLTKQNPQEENILGNFLTPTPTPGVDLSARYTPIPTAAPTEGKPTTQPISAEKSIIKTNKGNIELVLYPNDAPRTVTNFATLAKRGYYDNLTFHRVVPGFVIQGGDPNGDGTGGESIYGKTFEDEINVESQIYKDGYLQGILAMANRGANTNGSQFFIMLEDSPDLPKNYTIFGKVTNGIDVVKQIQVGDRILSIEVE